MQKWTLLLLLSLTLSEQVIAEQSVEQKGLEIAQEADRRDDGFGDSRVDLIMLLKNKNGNESSRYIRLRTLETEGDGDKSMSIFDRPRDVKGTAFLSYTHKQDSDDQWLFLPALKRVKRIASRNKSGSFMGSEFAFEDLSSQEIEKYTYKFLRDEDCGDLKCFVIERDPVDKYSGYTRQEVWIDKNEYRVQKTKFYDRKNSLLKTLVVSGYSQYLDKYWRPSEMFMDNHQTGKSTLLTWSNYKFRNGYTARDFDRSSLKRAR